jgi:hypothetical protein
MAIRRAGGQPSLAVLSKRAMVLLYQSDFIVMKVKF